MWKIRDYFFTLLPFFFLEIGKMNFWNNYKNKRQFLFFPHTYMLTMWNFGILEYKTHKEYAATLGETRNLDFF